MMKFVKTVKGIAIKNGKILLCRKTDVWDFPGGKPERDESNLECLAREISFEEIPCTEFEVVKYYHHFRGLSPHKRQPTTAVDYFIRIKKIGKIPDKRADYDEIREIAWVRGEDIGTYLISETASKAIYSLIRNKYL